MQPPAAPDAAITSAFSIEAVAALLLATLAAIAAGLLAGALTRRLLIAIEGDRFHNQHLAKATVTAVRRIVFVLGLLVITFPALDLAGVEVGVGLHPDDVSRWVARSGVRVLLLILMAFAATRFAASVIRNTERAMADDDNIHTFERRKRLQTVGGTLRRFFSIIIWTAASLMVLRELDIDITPILTGAGIIGLAVGFGAQTLVKDIISGLFLIAEDQVRIGDVVDINGVGGAVEDINLRTIILRDTEGTVHTISNGDIRTLANRSKDFAFYVIDLAVGYDDDTDRIVEIVSAVAKELMDDPDYKTIILAPLEVIGVDAFKPTEVTLRFRIKTLPLKQWTVGRELRRRIKKAFDVNNIRIPTPQMSIRLRSDGAVTTDPTQP